MSNTVVASEAKLVVRLDTSKAEQDMQRLADRQPAAGPEAPTEAKKPPKDTDEASPPPGSRARERAPSTGDSATAWRKLGTGAWEYSSAAVRGGLYQKTMGALQSIPVAGMAIAATEHQREYGPLWSSAIASAAEGVSDPVVGAALNGLAKTVQAISVGTVNQLNRFEAILNSFGETLNELKDVSVGSEVMGGMDPTKMASFGVDIGRAHFFMRRMQQIHELRRTELLGASMGQSGKDIFRAIFGTGSAGR